MALSIAALKLSVECLLKYSCAQWKYAKFNCSECHNVELQCEECRYSKCRYTECRGAPFPSGYLHSDLNLDKAEKPVFLDRIQQNFRRLIFASIYQDVLFKKRKKHCIQ